MLLNQEMSRMTRSPLTAICNQDNSVTVMKTLIVTASKGSAIVMSCGHQDCQWKQHNWGNSFRGVQKWFTISIIIITQQQQQQRRKHHHYHGYYDLILRWSSSLLSLVTISSSTAALLLWFNLWSPSSSPVLYYHNHPCYQIKTHRS